MAMSPFDGAISTGQAVVSGSAVGQKKKKKLLEHHNTDIQNRRQDKWPQMLCDDIIIYHNIPGKFKFYAHVCHQIWRFGQDYRCCKILFAVRFIITMSAMPYAMNGFRPVYTQTFSKEYEYFWPPLPLNKVSGLYTEFFKNYFWPPLPLVYLAMQCLRWSCRILDHKPYKAIEPWLHLSHSLHF